MSLTKMHWPIDHLDRLLEKYAYTMDDHRTKGYVAWVSPQDFLAATTPAKEMARIQSQTTPLNRVRLNYETQEICLEGKIHSSLSMFMTSGHEGRHRMAALHNAGFDRVPVVFYVHHGHHGEKLNNHLIAAQQWEHASAQSGFRVQQLIPISWAHRKDIQNEFFSPFEQQLNPWMNKDLASNGCSIANNFANWFGNSQVVNDQGWPLPVFHGTAGNFDQFKITKLGEFGPGVYFSSSAQEASDYTTTNARMADASPNVIAVYLRLENPFIVCGNAQSFWEKFAKDTDTDDSQATQRARELGHDGVIFDRPVQKWIDGKGVVDTAERQKHYVIFDASQAKSVLGNSGLYLRDSASLTDQTHSAELTKAQKAIASIPKSSPSKASTLSFDTCP